MADNRRNLRQANLSGQNLDDANLCGADLTGARGLDLPASARTDKDTILEQPV